MRRSSKRFTALRQLAALGLPGRAVIPEAFECLKDVIGFDSASLTYLDENLAPYDMFETHDVNPAIGARYLERWFNREEADFYPAQIRMQTDAEFSLVRVSNFTSRFSQTELYEEVFKPIDHYWVAGLALRDGTRPIGNITLGRTAAMADFSDDDMNLLGEARALLTQAVSRWDSNRNDDAEHNTRSQTAMIIADLSGRVHHMTGNSSRLLRQAANIRADREMLNDGAFEWARPVLATLARRISASLRGRETRPATMTITSSYGYFVLRAYALNIGVADGKNLISVQIERHVPLALQLFASPKFRNLSLREREVCRLMVAGLSHADVAAALGVKPSTAITHTRNLYAKLGVHDRESLIRTLLPDSD